MGVDLKKFVNEHFNDCGGMNALHGQFTYILHEKYPYKKDLSQCSGVFDKSMYNTLYIDGEDCLIFNPRKYDIYEGTNSQGEQYSNIDPYRVVDRLKVKKQTYSPIVLKGVLKYLENDLQQGCKFFKLDDLDKWVDKKMCFIVRAELEKIDS